MITVIVKRGLGDKPGPDISDPLITSEVVAVARGTAEIDRNYSDRAMVPTTGPYVGYITPGGLVNVTEIEGSWRGVVNRCSLTFNLDQSGNFQANTDLEIEKEA